MRKEIQKSIVFNGEKECTNEIERQLQLPAKCELCGIGQKERARRKKSQRGTEKA